LHAMQRRILMANEWFYEHNGEKFGLLTIEQFRSVAAAKAILPTDLIWKKGMTEWVKASRLKRLLGQPYAGGGTASMPLQPPVEIKPLVNSEPAKAKALNSSASHFGSGNKPFSDADPSSTNGQINATLSAAKRHGAGFVGRFKQIDFKREVWPLNAETVGRLAKEPAFGRQHFLQVFRCFL
jgi:GYF domain 2